jgi:hypothetical protein
MANLGVQPCAPRVHLIIAGAEDVWTGAGNKMMFLAQAVRRVYQTSSQYDRACVIYFSPSNDKIGYSDEQEKAFEDAFKNVKIMGHDVHVQKVKNISEMAEKIDSYLASLESDGCKSRGVIKRMDIYAHGSPRRIGLVYTQNIDFDNDTLSLIKPEWFDEGAAAYSWACQTMNSDIECYRPAHGHPAAADYRPRREESCSTEQLLEASIGAAMSRTWGITTYGYMRQTLYDQTWGTGLSGRWDELVGNRFSVKGKTRKNKNVNTVWEPSGADGPVTVGKDMAHLPERQFKVSPDE